MSLKEAADEKDFSEGSFSEAICWQGLALAGHFNGLLGIGLSQFIGQLIKQEWFSAVSGFHVLDEGLQAISFCARPVRK
ncbi:MAG: hypothetical protein U5K54_19395 [Cytophagales bacterium]|nr:hypothetical protein [Cytophagales bacterium]